MNKRPSQEFRFVHLDMVRGVAALLVCLQHLRHLDFIDYSDLEPKPSLYGKLFYLLTGQGHNSVVIFFVLSGFFVAGSVATDFDGEKWSWGRYAIRRMSRLYVVLIPALLLTFLWDSVGQHFTSVSYPGTRDFFTFVGGLIFTQSIFTPAFGSNGPLWSIAFEFWYYLMFPLLYGLFAFRGRPLARVISLVLFLGCVVVLPGNVLKGGVVWLMGYGAFVLFHHPRFSGFISSWRIFVLGVLGMGLSGWMGSTTHGLPLGDVTTITLRDMLMGLSFGLTVPFLALHQPGVAWYRKVAVGLSDISYTLYAVHFPVIVFFTFTLIGAKNAVPSVSSYMHFVGYLGMILFYATAVWWLFESRTGVVRKFLERTFLASKTGRGVQG
jgi:peptidoglycan/LPS O-acetylase OafA/YrhL